MLRVCLEEGPVACSDGQPGTHGFELLPRPACESHAQLRRCVLREVSRRSVHRRSRWHRAERGRGRALESPSRQSPTTATEPAPPDTLRASTTWGSTSFPPSGRSAACSQAADRCEPRPEQAMVLDCSHDYFISVLRPTVPGPLRVLDRGPHAGGIPDCLQRAHRSIRPRRRYFFAGRDRHSRSNRSLEHHDIRNGRSIGRRIDGRIDRQCGYDGWHDRGHSGRGGCVPRDPDGRAAGTGPVRLRRRDEDHVLVELPGDLRRAGRPEPDRSDPGAAGSSAGRPRVPAQRRSVRRSHRHHGR